MAAVLESAGGELGPVKAGLYLPGPPGTPWQLYRVFDSPEPAKTRQVGFRGNG